MSEGPVTGEGDPHYVFVSNKMLRRGYTTGSCAAAASKAAAIMLVTGRPVDRVQILTPKGIPLDLPAQAVSMERGRVTCAIMKDGGDDVDATDGMLIYSTVTLSEGPEIHLDGGAGIGRVTRKGLDQPVGEAAINHVPRNMIKEVLEDVRDHYGMKCGFDVKISAPEGEKIAERTFNSRLGIIGGISILGTSGIVEPMSEAALVDTIRVEVRMNLECGNKYLLVVPGNYGKDFSETDPEICSQEPIKCSNFIGDTLDMACGMGAKGILLVGNLGKMVKLAGGIMNTHSRNADCRMEIMAANAAIAGADAETVREVMGCISTDDALDVLNEAHIMEKTVSLMIEKIQFHMNHRTAGKILTGAVVFSSAYGMLGKTESAAELMERIKEQIA
jgi:cobalt-precorrin-5B (C1)-methyltransferase